ncbi:MAG: phenylalanine--tRNA ligase subunit beta [Cyanobacteria bacterium J06641_5]
MQVSLNWLRSLVDCALPAEELAETLTLAGFEVEDIEDLGRNADGVVVGRVLEREQHPNADKLSVCKVDIGGEEPSTIVCGAANVRADIFVPIATLGTYLPIPDLKIKKSKLRGVASEGMICSLSEVGIEKDSDGIHIFGEVGTNDLQPGTDSRPLLGLDDIVLDVTSTANRADALSMVGIAREVVALTGSELHLPEPPELPDVPETGVSVAVANSDACPAYIGTLIQGVKIGPSPEWLQWRLQRAGVRPINNVVDVTNYVLLEWGQPLHAFDRDRLQALTGSDDIAIGVRFAKDGETLKTLDDQDRTLQPQNLLITAGDKPVALAGVMGGAESEVFDGTQNLVLEAALFDPATTRRSARAQGLRTEASARYERGVNFAELEIACNRAIALILELAGGEVIGRAAADARPAQLGRTIELRLERVLQLLGPVKQDDGSITAIATAQVEQILSALGCQLELTGSRDSVVWLVKVPPYRYRDLEREIDLIEEIARLHGYDKFCDTLPRRTELGYLPAPQKARNRLRETFRGVGFTELVQYSLVKPEQADIAIDNPLLSEYSALRKELLSGLIDAFAYNWTRGNGALNGFEIGRCFWHGGDGSVQEADRLAGIFGGDRDPEGRWTRGGKDAPLDWYTAKGILESTFARLSLSVEYKPDNSDPRLHPGRTASLWLDGKQLGLFGQLHPQLRQERDLPDAVYAFSLDVTLLLAALTAESQQRPLFAAYSTYPAVARDIAFFAPQDLAVATLAGTMQKAAGKLLERAELFDEYKGDNVPEGQRSLAFNLVFRAGDRTLTDADVDPLLQKVRNALTANHTVTLRS